LKASEKVANDVSTRARADVMKIAEDEVARSEKQVAGSLTDLRTFRESAGFIDPKIQEESAGKLLEQLTAQRIRLQTEYSVSSHAMSPEAPTLQALKSRLDQLTLQIAQEKAKLTNQSKGSGALADLLPKYEELVVHNQFAEKLYTLAADGLERARLRALTQTIYVNVFVPPVLPQEALFPERFASSLVISLVLFILWGIGALTAALVEDHKL
jgi:capsular polysaccharide transport system permease protein